MTNLEALQSLINLDLPDLHTKVLIDNSVVPSGEYSAANKDIIELCSAYVYQVELTHPEFSEGSLKIAVNSQALKDRMNAIFNKYGLGEQTTTIEPKIKFKAL